MARIITCDRCRDTIPADGSGSVLTRTATPGPVGKKARVLRATVDLCGRCAGAFVDWLAAAPPLRPRTVKISRTGDKGS